MSDRTKIRAIQWLLRLKTATFGFINYIVFDHFFNADLSIPQKYPIAVDPASRKAWIIVTIVGMVFSLAATVGNDKKVRLIASIVTGLMMFVLGLMYLWLVGLSLGIWFILILGISFLSSAGAIYFLHDNLVQLQRFNKQVGDLEQEFLNLKDKIKHGTD